MSRALVVAREARAEAEAEVSYLRRQLAVLVRTNFELSEILEVGCCAGCNVEVR